MTLEKRKSVQKIVPVALYGLSVLALLGIVRILILMNDDSRLITAFIPGIVFCSVLFSFFFIKARKYGKKDYQKFLAQIGWKGIGKKALGYMLFPIGVFMAVVGCTMLIKLFFKEQDAVSIAEEIVGALFLWFFAFACLKATFKWTKLKPNVTEQMIEEIGKEE